MKTREEILKLWGDYDLCDNFEPVLIELLDNMDSLKSDLKEMTTDRDKIHAERFKLLEDVKNLGISLLAHRKSTTYTEDLEFKLTKRSSLLYDYLNISNNELGRKIWKIS